MHVNSYIVLYGITSDVFEFVRQRPRDGTVVWVG